MVRLQELAQKVSRSARTQSSPPKPVYLSRRKSSSSFESGDALSHTEALLDQILSGPGLSNLDLTATIDAQERRSLMVVSCQQELQDAVDEFNDLVGKTSYDEQQKPPRSNPEQKKKKKHKPAVK